MSPVEQGIALAGLEALKGEAAKEPWGALAAIALTIAQDVVSAGHEDPAEVLHNARAELRDAVAKAIRAKFGG